MLRLQAIGTCVGALAVTAPLCAADPFPNDYGEPPPLQVDPYSYAWSDPRMQSRIGVAVTLGAGVTGFTDSALRDAISNDVGGSWNVRISIGTHIPIGVELNYLGTAAKLVSLSDEYGGVLVGTTFEAVLRYTILPHAVGTPYVFIGGGWQRFDVADQQFALADTGMRGTDSVAELPFGAGVAYRGHDGWMADLRGTFRTTGDSSLVTLEDGDHAELDSWEATAALGYEF